MEGKVSKPKEEPPKDEPQEVKEKVEKFYKVRITKEQSAQGVRIAIPAGDGEKINVRLPADGKRFRIKDRNLLVIASVEG